MIRRLLPVAALMAGLALPAPARAHPGHEHKVMGTVSMRHENHVEVKAVDGKSAVFTLNADTKILRGKSRVKADDIKPGERIVVRATETKGKDGKQVLVATEVRLPPSSAGASR